MKKGFTLVELVVVVAVMVLLGLIFTDILVQTLRGKTKIKVMTQVKQNGQLILDRLASDIRRADQVVCVNDNHQDGDRPTDTIVLHLEGRYLRYRMYRPNDSINSFNRHNGFLIWDYIRQDVAETSPVDELCDGSQQFLDAQQLGLYGTQGQGDEQENYFAQYLSDLDKVNGVSIDYDDDWSVNNGIANKMVFKLDRRTGYNDSVTIRFRAYAGIEAGSAYEASVKEGGILFATAAQVRSKKQ